MQAWFTEKTGAMNREPEGPQPQSEINRYSTRHFRLRFFFPGIKWDGLALTQGTHQPRFGVVAGCVVALGVPNKLPGPMTSAVL